MATIFSLTIHTTDPTWSRRVVGGIPLSVSVVMKLHNYFFVLLLSSESVTLPGWWKKLVLFHVPPVQWIRCADEGERQEKIVIVLHCR